MPGYTMGTPPVELCKHTEAESRYWKHIRESARHQAILDIRARGVAELLAALPEALNTAKVHQKLMRDPAYTPLRSLFR